MLPNPESSVPSLSPLTGQALKVQACALPGSVVQDSHGGFCASSQALDIILEKMKASGFDFSQVLALSGAGQVCLLQLLSATLGASVLGSGVGAEVMAPLKGRCTFLRVTAHVSRQ